MYFFSDSVFLTKFNAVPGFGVAEIIYFDL